jgi:hypothetical protein
VVTFADMAKAMAALGQNLKDESKAEVNMKVDGRLQARRAKSRASSLASCSCRWR